VFLFGERGRFAPPGVAGGRAAALNRFTYEQADGEHQPPMASKMVGIKLDRGRKMLLETPGGGGYGDPFERSPETVAEDVRRGFVSRDRAAADYGVAITADGELDHAATRRARTREAE
jgi:N-methylhydantoinase B